MKNKNNDFAGQFLATKNNLFLSFSLIILVINIFFIGLNPFVFTNEPAIENQFFFLVFPHIVGIIAIITGFAINRYQEFHGTKNDIPLILSFLAILSVTITTFDLSLWIQAFWLGGLTLFSIYLLNFLFSDFSSELIRVGRKIIILLTVIFILVEILARISPFILFFQPHQVIIFWSVSLLMVSWIFSIFRVGKLRKIDKYQIKDFFIIFSSLSLFPFLLALADQFSIDNFFWVNLSFLLGLLWLNLYEFNVIQRNNSKLGLTDVSGFSGSLFAGALLGVIILIFSTYNTKFANNYFGLFVGIYLLIFSFGLYFFLFKFRKELKINVVDKSFSMDQEESDSSNIEELIHKLHLLIIEKISPENFRYFFFEPTQQKYVAFAFDEITALDINFEKKSPFPQFLLTQEDFFIIDDLTQLSNDLISEIEVLKLLDNNIYIPLKNGNNLIGWISFTLNLLSNEKLHEKLQTIQPIIHQFKERIVSLMNQDYLIQREKNFNTLSRIVQGVNYTLNLDDIYELIYTQTTHNIPCEDFYIIQKDEDSSLLRFVFYVENSERIHQNENQKILLSETIEAQVVSKGLGVIANNYINYCEIHKFDPLYKSIENAMIVPLNSGAETNGCITIANQNPNNKFSIEQLDFLQAIADLVAGAIDKAKLLQKTEDYVRQLSLMNNLVRKLSSTLNIEELFNSILLSINELVAFEKGRLLIVDQMNEEIILKTCIEDGILIDDKKHNHKRSLILKDLVQSNKPFIMDRNQNFDIYVENIYREDTVIVHSLIILPIVVKENTVGFIELVNKKDNNFFTENEKQLLQAFTSQASITIENTRLYLQTDQELSERVAELSIMQKIDRELNASLDINTILNITLAWAMKSIGAEVGLIGLVKDNQLIHLIFQGFEEAEEFEITEVTNKLENELLSTDLPTIPFLRNQKNSFLHTSTKTQVIIPILREGAFVAIIILEMFQEFVLSDSTKRFLERLSDHASLAIINSQLYEEVQKANLAKSEFVSLVAHELKNPMTSIKGYTELLSTGTAGEISTTQEKFLAIIRNNIVRMDTLVSDLNDLTKIEAGSLRIEAQHVDVEKIISELRRTLQKPINEKEQKFSIIISKGISQVWADPNRLLQILLNLVSNASKYTPSNGNIELLVKKEKNSLSQIETEYVAHFSIKDNGVGIKEEDKNLIFQKFFRSEDPAVRTSSGTGLGLNITKNLVEMQGGSIWFESEYQKGTTFHFVVPLAN